MAERWGRFVVGNFPWTAGATRPGPSPSPPVQDRARLQASSVEGEGILRNAASRSPRVIPRERAVREPPLRRVPFALRKGWGTSDILRASGGGLPLRASPASGRFANRPYVTRPLSLAKGTFIS